MVKSIILIIIGLVIVFSGCINSTEPAQKTQPIVIAPNQAPKVIEPISIPTNEISTMSFTEFYDAMRSNDLTTLQKENLYVNKIFMWTGKVIEVTQDTVLIQNEYCNGEGINRLCHPMNVNLYVDDDQKPKLISLSKGSIISFEGKITKKFLYFSSIDMYNAKIVTQGNIVLVKQPTNIVVQTPKRNPYNNQAPIASIRAAECKNGILKLQHQGGADLILSDVRITIDQGQSSMIYEPGSQSNDKFVAGDTLVFTTPTNISLNGRTLTTGKITGEIYTGAGFRTTILDIPTGQQIAGLSCIVFP